MSSCASYVSWTHDIIDDVSKSWIVKLLHLNQYSSKSVGQRLNISEMPMAILSYLTSSITTGKKISKWQPFWKCWYIEHCFNLAWHDRSTGILQNKNIFHGDDVIDDVTVWSQIRPSKFLYKWNETFFIITKLRTKISSLITGWRLHLYKFV